MIRVGDFGGTITINMVQEDGTAYDASGGDILNIRLWAPGADVCDSDGNLLGTLYTATFVTDGTDGALEMTIPAGLFVVGTEGQWRKRAEVSNAGATFFTGSEIGTFPVYGCAEQG